MSCLFWSLLKTPSPRGLDFLSSSLASFTRRLCSHADFLLCSLLLFPVFIVVHLPLGPSLLTWSYPFLPLKPNQLLKKSIPILSFSCIFCLCVLVCVCDPTCCGTHGDIRRQLRESVLPSHHVGRGDRVQVVGLGSKSHLSGLVSFLSS